jgi:hypothetical protein
VVVVVDTTKFMHGDLVQAVQKTAQEILVAALVQRPLAVLQLQQLPAELIVAEVAEVLVIPYRISAARVALVLLWFDTNTNHRN